MPRKRKVLKSAVLIFAAVVILAQFIRIDKSSPPVRSDVAAGTTVQPVLQRVCYNCHSNVTVWPWYSNVAPASWLVGSDVHEGRQHLNFSEWGTYDIGTRSHKLHSIAEEVQSGDMPPWYYALMHREAHLSPAERSQILAWTSEAEKAAAK
jgi:hypothetical protein